MNIRKLSKDFINNIASKTNTKIHTLDYAVKLACQNYKSAFTNYKNGNIKTFRIRYWRNNKEIKIIDLEKNDFVSGSIRKRMLGDVIGYYNGIQYDFKKIYCDCRMQWNTIEKTYKLFVPIHNENETYKNKSDYISLDPGIRTFMTGITNNNVVEIGKKIQNNIKKYLKRIDKINNNKNISKKIKNKNEIMCNKKINNCVDELHWKTIHFLTTKYNNILIGDMSIKRIISKNNNLTKLTKRIGQKLKFYKFTKRLEFKCSIRETKMKIINEKYTSKMCSNCGNIKNDLGSSKTYNCDKCKIKIDRDINGSRGILLKGLL